MGQFIGNLWDGRTYSLAKHYWLFLMVPGVIFSALAKVLEFNSLSLSPYSYSWLSGALWTIAIIAFVIGYVGLINCARVRNFRGWSAAAVVLTTLSLLMGIAGAAMEFSGNPLNPTRELYDAAATLNAQLPKKVDNITTLTRTAYDDNVFAYYYDIDPAGYQSTNWSADELKTHIRKNACDTFKGSLGTPTLRAVRYVYKMGAKDNIVIDIGKNDCEQ